MKLINSLMIIIFFSAASAFSEERSTTKSILNELKTNSMVEIKTPVLKEETVPASGTDVFSKTIPPATNHIENTNPVNTPQPVLETNIKPVELKTQTVPEIKTPAKVEPATKIEEHSPASKDSNLNVVHIVSTADEKTIFAQLTLTEQSDGILIKGTFKGVPNPGNHGIHIHENGSCADKGNGAGGHFNPDHRQHGDLEHRGHAEAHAGDMGNVEIDANGNANFKFLLVASSLHEGRYNIAGKSVILHEKADDFSQPTGNAGGRIGCGIIPSF